MLGRALAEQNQRGGIGYPFGWIKLYKRSIVMPRSRGLFPFAELNGATDSGLSFSKVFMLLEW